MKDNYEENWSPNDWFRWFKEREAIMADYNEQLAKYLRLPACDTLIHRELRKKYSEETLERAWEVIIPPITSVIHDWDSEEFYDAMGLNDDSEPPQSGDPRKRKKARMGDHCQQCCVALTSVWVGHTTVLYKNFKPEYVLKVIDLITRIQTHIIASGMLIQELQYNMFFGIINYIVDCTRKLQSFLANAFRAETQDLELQKFLDGFILDVQTLHDCVNNYAQAYMNKP